MDIGLYILLLMLLIGYEFARSKRGRFDLLSLINLFFLLGYILGPLWMLYEPASIPVELPYSRLLLTPVFAGIGYLSLLVGWIGIGRLSLRGQVLSVYGRRNFRPLMYFATAISFAMLYLYARAFGGFVDALTMGSLYRFSIAARENIEIGRSASALYFIGFAKITFLYSFYKITKHSNESRRPYWVVLVFSSLVIITFSVIQAGRGSIVGLLIVSFLILALTRKRFPLTPTIGLTLIIVFVIASGKNVISLASNYVATGSVDYSIIVPRDPTYIINRIVLEFGHPVISLEKAVETAGASVDYTYMGHFIYAPLHLVPSKLLNVSIEKPEPISYVNSMNLVGYNKGVPPGIVGSLYYGFGVLGIIVGMFLFGTTARFLQNTLYSWVGRYPGFLPITLLVFYNYSQFVINGDPKVALQANFYLFIAFIALFLAVRTNGSPVRRHTFLASSDAHPLVAST